MINLSANGNDNPNLVCIDKILKKILVVKPDLVAYLTERNMIVLSIFFIVLEPNKQHMRFGYKSIGKLSMIGHSISVHTDKYFRNLIKSN